MYKNVNMFRKTTKILFLVIGLLTSQYALAQLNPGDIVFVGFRFDGIEGDLGCNDGFSFAALVDIPANTTIYFTEDEYNGTAFEMGEGDISWVHTEIVTAGTVVQLTTHLEGDNSYCNDTNPGPTASVGTIQFENPGMNWSLGTSAEEIYAYLGAVRAPTTWLAALWTDNSDNSNVLPAELNGFLIDFTNVEQDADLGILTMGLDCPDRATCLANALNTDNWVVENDGEADCCDDDGVSYPGDLPQSLGACIQPTIEGIEIVECNGPNAFNTVRVNGELNGAAQWVWYDGTCGNPAGAPITTGEELSAFHSAPLNSVFVRAEGGCADENAACFEYIPAELFGPESFSVIADLCDNAGLQIGLGGGTPTGGVYSGPGVTDDGNGMTYSFDPTVAGVGAHEISYANDCGWSISDMVEVYASPVVTLSLPDTILVDLSMPLVNFTGTGMPEGGTYNDQFGEITDDGNGTTFSFDTLVIGINVISYTYTDPITGCTNSTSMTINLQIDPSTSITELDETLDFEIYPNPTNGILFLEGIPMDEITIFDAFGKTLLQLSTPDNTLDISDLPSGVYFVKARKDNAFITRKIIKQ
jgi:hypothetical protein